MLASCNFCSAERGLARISALPSVSTLRSNAAAGDSLTAWLAVTLGSFRAASAYNGAAVDGGQLILPEIKHGGHFLVQSLFQRLNTAGSEAVTVIGDALI
jgi:hypothetical protein